jgi:hypothetical protein
MLIRTLEKNIFFSLVRQPPLHGAYIDLPDKNEHKGCQNELFF